jgi:hypothetical protein
VPGIRRSRNYVASVTLTNGKIEGRRDREGGREREREREETEGMR